MTGLCGRATPSPTGPEWRNGRRRGFKILRRKVCEFESHLGHHPSHPKQREDHLLACPVRVGMIRPRYGVFRCSRSQIGPMFPFFGQRAEQNAAEIWPTWGAGSAAAPVPHPETVTSAATPEIARICRKLRVGAACCRFLQAFEFLVGKQWWRKSRSGRGAAAL